MEDLERIEARLDNIRAVEPILAALRTISLGSWQAAQKQKTAMQRYSERLIAILPSLLPHLPARRRARPEKPSPSARVVALVVGSERGLCGRFNAAIAAHAERYLAEQAGAGIQVELLALGTRVRRIFHKRGRPLAWWGRLSATALPSFDLAFDLTRRWLTRYEAREIDAVDLLYNAYRGAGRYASTTVRLIPPPLPAAGPIPSGLAQEEPWPPPIIETDPLGLYAQIIEQWVVISLYGRLLESAAAVHSVRFQLMEAATQNAARLIEELTLTVQTARRQAITQEMQELVAGAGLLGPQ
jgi:F-type H+-transporting ATPase subunit gamma